MTAAVQAERRSRLEALHQANAADLLSFIGRRVMVPADAADVLSDTFVVAWRRIDRLPVDPEEARMWLFGVARRAIANAQRGRHRQRELALKLGAHLESLPPEETDDVSLDVRAALATLPAGQAELMKLVLWDGFTLMQAAQILDLRESTARGRYERARLRLREVLRGDGYPGHASGSAMPGKASSVAR